MRAADLLMQLHDATLRKADPEVWGPFGALSVVRCDEADGDFLFEVVVPTDRYDCDDFVWKSELTAQTTDKFALSQGGSAIPGAAVIGIAREGDPSSEVPGENVYRLTFRLPQRAVRAGIPVTLRCVDHAGKVVSETVA